MCTYVVHCWKENLARDLTLEVWRSDWLHSTLSHHYIAVKPPVSLVQVFSSYLPVSTYFLDSLAHCGLGVMSKLPLAMKYHTIAVIQLSYI